MNIAICVSGIPRGVYSKELIKNIASNTNYKVCIFIHYWQDSGLAKTHSYTQKNDYPFDYFDYCIENCKLETQADNFENYLPEFQRQYDSIPQDKKVRKECGIYGMYYSIMKTGQMWQDYEKNNNMLFDCVIRSRFESQFKNSINNIEFEKFDLNCIWIPDVNYCKDTGMNDQLAFSNRENMQHYMNAYHKVTEYSQKYFYGPELILHKHLSGYKVHKQNYIF
jgi:hypothetical protein